MKSKLGPGFCDLGGNRFLSDDGFVFIGAARLGVMSHNALQCNLESKMGKDPNSSCHSSNQWPRWVTLAQVSMNPLLMVLGCMVSLSLINSKALASLDLEKELDRGIGYTACNALADDPGSLLAITMLESLPTDFEERVFSPMERRSYAISSIGNRLWAMPVGNAAVEFSVPDFPNRPLSGRWVNEKLLYLEVQIHRGPNTGIFWLIDLTSMDVLACEGWFVESPVEPAY